MEELNVIDKVYRRTHRLVWRRRPYLGTYKCPKKIGSGLSSIQDLCLGMRNYTVACVNKHIKRSQIVKNPITTVML